MQIDHVHRDFATLFKWQWLNDFPVAQEGSRGVSSAWANRATWTHHVARVVGRCATIMGWALRYETVNRHDAVLYDVEGEVEAVMEWEWNDRGGAWKHELGQLHETVSSGKAEWAVLLCYTRKGQRAQTKSYVRETWTLDKPLVLVTVGYVKVRQGRGFTTMKLYGIQKGEVHWKQKIPALPWDVGGSVWAGPQPKHEAAAQETATEEER